jgi:glycine dehydrogenase subunit 1
VVLAMSQRGMAAGFPLGRYYPGMEKYMIVAVTERRTKDEMEAYAKNLKEVLKGG